MVKECQEDEALRSINKNPAGNEKRRVTKKNTTKRGCENRQGRRDGSAEPAMLRSRARTRGRDTRRVVAQPFQTRALQTTQCLRPQMFARETSKKEQREDKEQQEEGPEDEAQLVKMIARLTLQHEFERMATSRADNVALEFEANSEIMVPMEASKEAQGAEVEKARKTSSDQFKVHPEGKKPDAMFRMLAFGLAAPVEKQKNDLDGAVGALKEQYQELAQRALQTVLITGRQAENDKDMRAKRCFDVKYKDGQRQCTHLTS